MDAKAPTKPTKSTVEFAEKVDSTVTQLSVAVECASAADGSCWVLQFMELPSGMAAFEEELLLKTGKPTIDILAECVKDTLEAVQQQKSSDKFNPDINTDKFVENGTTFVEKYAVWRWTRQMYVPMNMLCCRVNTIPVIVLVHVTLSLHRVTDCLMRS